MNVALADAHLHLFSRGFPGRCGRSVLGSDPEIDAYEAFRSAHGIQAGLIVGYEGEGIDPANNKYIRSLAATRPWMATLAYADPQGIPEPAAIEEWFDGGHVGIALYVPDQAASTSICAWPATVWRSLERLGAIVSLNAAPTQIETIAPLVEVHEGCTFLFSHLGLPGRCPVPPARDEAEDRLRPLLRLAPRPNAMVKISGLYAISDPPHDYPHAAAAPFIDLLIDRFGPERCLWGSDFSPALDFVSFVQTTTIPWLGQLTSEERSQVMGANLLRLLRRS